MIRNLMEDLYSSNSLQMKHQQKEGKNHRAIITIIKTYQIKTSCKGEVISDVISDVVDLCCSITDIIAAIYEDSLPEDFAQQNITVFTTMSVDQFNNLFTKLCNDLILH